MREKRKLNIVDQSFEMIPPGLSRSKYYPRKQGSYALCSFFQWVRRGLGTQLGFPGSSADKESARNAEDLCLIPGLERLPGEGKGYPLWHSGLENSMDCTWVTRSQTRLNDFHWHMVRGLTNLCCILKIILFIHLFLSVLGLHCCIDFSTVAVSGTTLSLQCAGFSFQWLLLLPSTGCRAWGLQ